MNPERFSWIESAMKRPGTWGMLITVTTLGSLLLIAFSMSVGVSGVVNHLLYIPIIITAYAYPRRGALFQYFKDRPSPHLSFLPYQYIEKVGFTSRYQK